jgi:hypothetical protein
VLAVWDLYITERINSTMPSAVGVLMSLRSFHHSILYERGDEHTVLITFIGRCASASDGLHCCTRNLLHD